MGTKKAVEYTYGATIAFGLLLMISAMLNKVLVAISPVILVIMQILGSFYMVYLAYQVYRMDASKSSTHQTGTFISGFLTQFLNPKVVLFTMTVIPTYILPYYVSIRAMTISVIGIMIIGFLAFMTWVLFGTIFKKFLQQHKKIINKIMAGFLIYAAIMLWIK